MTNLCWAATDTRLLFPCNNSIVSMEVPKMEPQTGADQPENEILSQDFIHTLSPISLTSVSPSSNFVAAASSSFLKVFDGTTNKCLVNISFLCEKGEGKGGAGAGTGAGAGAGDDLPIKPISLR